MKYRKKPTEFEAFQVYTRKAIDFTPAIAPTWFHTGLMPETVAFADIPHGKFRWDGEQLMFRDYDGKICHVQTGMWILRDDTLNIAILGHPQFIQQFEPSPHQ